MTPVLMIAGRYHLGDTPGIFQDAVYVGHELNFPFNGPWFDPAAATIGLRFHTTDVETWGNWDGHRVLVNGTEVGRLKDPDDQFGSAELFTLVVDKHTLVQAIGGSNNFVVTVALEHQPAQPGMADDFLFLRFETDGTFGARLGWK
jgi:hypothetical protein